MIWRICCALIYSGGDGDGGRVTKYEAQVRLLGTVFLATDACPWHICTCVQCIYISFVLVYLRVFHVSHNNNGVPWAPLVRSTVNIFGNTTACIRIGTVVYYIQTWRVSTASRTRMCQNIITILSANNWRARV